MTKIVKKYQNIFLIFVLLEKKYNFAVQILRK